MNFQTSKSNKNGELVDKVKFDHDVSAGNYFVRIVVGDKVYGGQVIYQQ